MWTHTFTASPTGSAGLRNQRRLPRKRGNLWRSGCPGNYGNHHNSNGITEMWWWRLRERRSGSVSGSCGERSTGCWWGSASRCVFPSALCALRVWTSTTAPLPTRAPPPGRPGRDPLGPGVRHHRLKLKPKLNQLGDTVEEPERIKRRRGGGRRSKASPWFVSFVPFCLENDQNARRLYAQQKNI